MLPVAATALLGVIVFRWATQEIQEQGRLSPGATRATQSLVALHALIVLAASAGAAGAVDVRRDLREAIGVPLLIVGVGLIAAALNRLRGLAFFAGVPPRTFDGGGIYRWLRHPLYLGWISMLLGVSVLGASVLALALVMISAPMLAVVARGEDRRLDLPAPRRRHRATARALLVGCTVAFIASLLAGCGGSSESAKNPQQGPRAQELQEQLGASTDPAEVNFPAVKGRSLQAFANSIGNVGPQAALATSRFRTGRNRLAFGVIDQKTKFLYGPSAVYVADKPSAPARGPYRAPADLLVTEAPFRSKQAATEKSPFAAIYSTEVPLPKPGKAVAVVVTQVGKQFVVAPLAIDVKTPQADKIPDVGEAAPRIHTDTVASAKGDIESIDTRQPTDSMHEIDFADVVGKRPVALLFATPQLCSSRVCGPVTDIAEQMKAEYGDRMDFIHQEVFVDNDASKGLRPQLQAFQLESEPWLFVIGADGKVVERLEGSFGLSAFDNAIRKALAA